MGSVLGLFWCLAAMAGGPENWSSAYDARLSQAMGAKPSDAIAIYEALIAQIPQGDEQRGEILYWLGRARWSAGDLAGARRSLESASRYRSARARVRILLGRMDAEKKAVERLPYRAEFRLNTDPWVRGWERGRSTDLALADQDGTRSLSWRTEVEEGASDFLLFGMHLDDDRLSIIEVQMRSGSLQGRYRFLLEDEDGQLWTAPVQSVSTDRWTKVSLPLSEFVRADAQTDSSRPDGRKLKWVILRDVTSLHTDQRGENVLYIDNLVLK
jgi:hypothetical protein